MDDLLKIELGVLLLRHGRKNVIDALAAIGGQTLEEIQAELAIVQQRRVRRNANVPSASELIGQLCVEKSEHSDLLQTLAVRYDNRKFLPHLRDVQRFLDRGGTRHGRMRSRREAAGRVVQALNRLPIEELRNLASRPEAQTESDYALLAKELMGRAKAG